MKEPITKLYPTSSPLIPAYMFIEFGHHITNMLIQA